MGQMQSLARLLLMKKQKSWRTAKTLLSCLFKSLLKVIRNKSILKIPRRWRAARDFFVFWRR